MILDIKTKCSQVTPIVTGEGDIGYPKMSKIGSLFTADWKTQLLAAGLTWQAHVGTVAGGGDVTPKLGGGSGTVVDNNQPELVIGVDAGFYLIPLEANVSIHGNFDGDADEAHILLYADRAAGPVTTNVSGTLHTPVNMLDGGGAFPGRCWVETIGDITEPVVSQWLDFTSISLDHASAVTMAVPPVIRLNYSPGCPPILAGPCQVVLVCGGTEDSWIIGTVTVAVVPTAYFPLS